MLRYKIKNFSHWIKNQLVDDQTYTSKRFENRFHFTPDFDAPKTFNEKINALKLSDECYKLAPFVDKFDVREIIKNWLGQEYLVDVIGVYDYFDRALFDSLPEQFAIKGTHGSAMNYLVYKKSEDDFQKLKKLTSKWLTKNFYYHGREKAYRYLKPRIIVEELMLEENGECPPDYKFYCFNGKPEFIHVDYARYSGHKRNLFDMNGDLMPVSYKREVDESKQKIDIDISHFLPTVEKLCEPFTFVRVDLYIYQGQIKFGELTFTPINGFGPITPSEYDRKFGDLLKIEKPYSFIRKEHESVVSKP